MAAAADPNAAAASSSAGDEDDEGTDSDASNSDRAAVQDPDRQLLPDAASDPPPPSGPEPTGPVPPPPQPAATDDSRRLFQRLWTDEEELLILRGFLDFTARRGTTFASHQYDTAPFYEEIRRLLSFDFTKSQLIEKLRRLKKKYRVCAARMAAQGAAFAFRSAHEGAIYDVARHIWRPAVRRDGGGDASDEDDINPAAAAAATTAGALPGAAEDGGGGSASAHTPKGRGSRRVRRKTAQELEGHALPTPTSTPMANDVVRQPLVVAVENLTPAVAQLPPAVVPSPAPAGATEEAVRAILSPLLRELIGSFTVAGQTGLGLGLNMGFGGVGGVDILGLGLGVAGSTPGVSGDEKWRQQQILELEVYLKRIELVREQVTAALEELSIGAGVYTTQSCSCYINF